MWLVRWISRGHSRAPGRHESARQCCLRSNKQRLFSPEMCRCLSSPWLWECQTLSSQLKFGSIFLADHLYMGCKEIQDPCQLSDFSLQGWVYSWQCRWDSLQYEWFLSLLGQTIWEKPLTERRVYLGSQSEGPVHQSREGTAAGTRYLQRKQKEKMSSI